MKKLIVLLSLSFLFAITSNACVKDHPITFDQLPQTAQQFIKAHFSQYNISAIIADNDSFDVLFENGYKVDFDKKGNWEEVECPGNEVPVAIVPPAIQNHIRANYANNFIVEISKDNRKYDVQLNNGLDLEFDKNGNFLRIDD